MRSDLAISVKHLTKTYRSFSHVGDRVKQFLGLGLRSFYTPFTALNDVSFDIRRGETVGIIGRNGSGKSTLLQLICGILKASSGTIEAQGRISALLELGAGFNPEFTGRENVYFFSAIMGIDRSEVDERFRDIEAFADIGEFIDRPVRTYSSGMYVRLAFAAAIHVKPDVLVIDEALAVGDSAFQAKCFEKIREFQRAGTTVLLVTHSLDLVAAHCQRALLLDHGHLVASGSPKTAIDEYRRRLNLHAQAPVPAQGHPSSETGRQWAGLFSENRDEVRYGSRDSEIIEAGWFTREGSPTQVLYHDDHYILKLRVRRLRPTSSPFFSYVIKDLRGVVLSGSNTEIESLSVNSLAVDMPELICFEMPMLLNPGHYMLSVGSQAHGPDSALIAHDHRTDYLPFEVIGKVRYGFFAAPVSAYLEERRP